MCLWYVFLIYLKVGEHDLYTSFHSNYKMHSKELYGSGAQMCQNKK